MSDTSALGWDIEGHIALLTLNRPDNLNLISQELTDALVAACARLRTESEVRCVILTGSGRAFCAGGNLNAMHRREHHFAGSAAQIRASYDTGVQRLVRSFEQLDVPVIAAVNGAAMGAGLDLALMCDIRVAAESAKFAESFIRLGLVSAAGGSWLLQRLVGPSVAAELTLTGDTFDASRAKELGLVSSVVPDGELMETVRELAARISRHPPHAIRMNKRLLRESRNAPLEASLSLAASLQGIAQHTQDHREAVAAAVEKRAPRFRGE